MRVKSRKPPAENLITSDEVTCCELVGGADDGVGDQMRQMAGDREHEVMMIRRHDLDLGAERGPERAQLLGRVGIGAFRRGQDAPAVDEELGEAGIGTGMLGAGDGMRGNEMHVGGRCGAMSAHDGALDRADVGDDRARREMRRDLLRHRTAGADGNAEDDEVGVLDRLRIGRDHGIDDAEFLHPRARLLGARGGDDLAGQALALRGARDRAADQAEADQRDALEVRVRAHLPAMKSRKPVDHEAVGLLGADGHAQRMRQAVVLQRRAARGRAW